jgi:hypothetical protein
MIDDTVDNFQTDNIWKIKKTMYPHHPQTKHKIPAKWKETKRKEKWIRLPSLEEVQTDC